MILARLRDQTRCQHERVERSVNFPDRLQTIAGYRDLLARFYGYYAPLEHDLRRVIPAGLPDLDFQARAKAPLLARDLLAFGCNPETLASLPACSMLPPVSNVHQALGCMYVLEGATLGGQQMRRLVQQRFGLDRESGCAFFTSYGDRVGGMWKNFCELLTAYASRDVGMEDLIISAAAETFGTFENWIEGAPKS